MVFSPDSQCSTLPRDSGVCREVFPLCTRSSNGLSAKSPSELRGLDAETTQLHPKGLAYKWSAQQVVEHLVLGYRLTSSALETRLNKGRLSRNQTRTYLQWSLQLMILSFGALPRGVPALDETMPTAGRFAAMDGRQLGDLLRQEIERHGHPARWLPA